MEEELLSRHLHKVNAKYGKEFTLWYLRFEAMLQSKVLLELVSTYQLEGTSIAELSSEQKSKYSVCRVIFGARSR